MSITGIIQNLKHIYSWIIKKLDNNVAYYGVSLVNQIGLPLLFKVSPIMINNKLKIENITCWNIASVSPLMNVYMNFWYNPSQLSDYYDYTYSHNYENYTYSHNYDYD